MTRLDLGNCCWKREGDIISDAISSATRRLGLGFRDEALGFRDEGLGFKDEGLGFRDEGLGFRDEALGFRDEGLGFRLCKRVCRVQVRGFVRVLTRL